ncbi:serine carboxypeptidase-like 40 [Iris pallida]|uniref:Serine carboxypeptidase-like 40 n=1 Tax=Iris pallida TaxID=29817 RepID=A0AAX6F8L6_IRIPA|nr:serine carboxypeptidase-like 40 [Iris pallida]
MDPNPPATSLLLRPRPPWTCRHGPRRRPRSVQKNKMGAALLSCILFTCSFLALLRSYDATPPSAGAAGPEAEPRAYAAPQVGLKEADRIPSLVDQPKGNSSFNQYAGYVTVDPKHGRALFYYFVESPQEPTKKPLVLWLTGGPGCSSLGYGAMSQVGPFRVNSHRKLYENPYALNTVANVIFLEYSAGVGFSYSNTTSDYELSGDKRTAQDSHTFLVNWLERFPDYKNRDFYMAGSSYSGHYIPQLAKLILLENNKTDKPINLNGIAIGNPYLDTYINTIKDRYEFLWSHAMYSDETHATLLKTCNMTSFNSTECLSVRSQADREIGGIDLFNIYAPFCHSNGSSSSNVKPLEYDPCNDYYVLDYLNNPSVQKTLHAVPRNWTFCSTWINIEHTTMLHNMKQLIASGLRVWLYRQW